jgi:prevent-host-death family protein
MTKSGEWSMQASVHEAKTNLSRLLEAVARGERVVITRNGVPAAELVPTRPASVRLGSLRGVVAPPPEAFLTPLDDAELRLWEGADDGMGGGA